MSFYNDFHPVCLKLENRELFWSKGDDRCRILRESDSMTIRGVGEVDTRPADVLPFNASMRIVPNSPYKRWVLVPRHYDYIDGKVRYFSPKRPLSTVVDSHEYY